MTVGYVDKKIGVTLSSISVRIKCLRYRPKDLSITGLRINRILTLSLPKGNLQKCGYVIDFLIRFMLLFSNGKMRKRMNYIKLRGKINIIS